MIVIIIIGTTGISVSSVLAEKSVKNLSTKYLTILDNGATVSVKKGDKIHLELKDYGDGGYSWSIVSLNQNILSLKERTSSQPSGLMGDFGNDIWVFTAENTGSITLSLECKQPWNGGETSEMVAFTIQVIEKICFCLILFFLFFIVFKDETVVL